MRLPSWEATLPAIRNFAFFSNFDCLTHPTDHCFLSFRKWRFHHHSSLGTHEKRKTSLWRNSFHKFIVVVLCFKQLLFVLKNYTLLNSYNYHYIIIRESFRIEINEWVYISWIKDRIILHSRSYCQFYIYKMFRDEMYLIEL